MSDLYIDANYTPVLTLRETEKAIKLVKEIFERNLSARLNLERVSAPLFLRQGSGINDDLNGIERKVAFPIKSDGDAIAECLFSLAKWKRLALAEYGFAPGEGLYTDMNAIRADEEVLDNLHSVYVDQWDWERVITSGQRSLDFLKEIVRNIYSALLETEQALYEQFPRLEPVLPPDIAFVHTEELAERYPDLTPRERENRIAEEKKAVFVIGIGGELPDGNIHDGRAPDYDDWITPTLDGRKGLNGDILLCYPLLKRAFEISSMGIRVDKETLVQQLEIRGCLERRNMYWHQRLLNDEFPLSIGGGIGQSRLCMFLLRKLHIGEVHASIWPEDTLRRCRQAGIRLL